MKPLGIHVRILVVAFLVIGTTTFILGMVGVRITSSFLQERFQDRITFLARYLALNSEVGVLINDRSGLESLAHNLLGEKDVVRVMILDSDDTSLVDLSRPADSPMSVVEVPVVFKRARGENVIFNDGLRVFQNPFVQTPPHVEDVIGRVKIHFTTREIDQLTDLISKKFIWISTALACVAVLLFYIISRSIGTELNMLTLAARQIERGDFNLRVSPGKLPETRALSIAFNAMLDSLDKSQKALQRANREMVAQKVMADMGRFSMMVAHEVKNPLAIIKSSLDMLKTDLNIDNDQTMVVYIEDEINRLNRLIEAFLQFSRPMKPIFREVDVNRMLADLIERFEITYHDEAISIQSQPVDRPAIAVVDRDLLARAIGNIIKNACDAAGPQGMVFLQASVDDDLSCWRVAISDTGPGIDPAHKGELFEPFFTTKPSGTGLGLPFSAQVVKAHGGFILAENGDNGGAVFTIEIPMQHDLCLLPDSELDVQRSMLEVP